MISKFLGLKKHDIGIDLGTCNTLIYLRGQGIVISEPSVIAVEKGTGEIRAVGAEAKKMLWKTPERIMTIRPLRDGVIANPEMTEKMIQYFIQKVLPKRTFVKSRMVIGVPSCITEVERRAVIESAEKAGAAIPVQLKEESLLAAIGAHIPINEPAGNMIVDIGGGTSEFSVISMGGMVISKAIRIGGDEFDEAIVKHIRNIHNLKIGLQTAENLKINIVNALPEENSIDKMEIKGTDAITGLPRRLEVDSIEIREAIQEPIIAIVEEVKKTLAHTPEELANDICERGIVMAGGGSLLKGLPKLVAKETGVPVILAENPLLCVANGAGMYFDISEELEGKKGIYSNF